MFLSKMNSFLNMYHYSCPYKSLHSQCNHYMMYNLCNLYSWCIHYMMYNLYKMLHNYLHMLLGMLLSRNLHSQCIH